ncbi:hypothetical protein AB4Y87_25050 [Paenarthrobacter sp. RAF54_2]
MTTHTAVNPDLDNHSETVIRKREQTRGPMPVVEAASLLPVQDSVTW